MDLKDYIRSIKDYPKKGILFRDITTLIKDELAFEKTINQIVEKSKKFALILAGNIPFVGLHDLLCIWFLGHKAFVKLSTKDTYLLPYAIHFLENSIRNLLEKKYLI